MGNKQSGRRDHTPRGGGRPPSPYVERNGVIAVKIDQGTRAIIELLAARRQQSPGQIVADALLVARDEELADPAAALDKAIATLEHRLSVCAKLGTMSLAERERVAAAIDRLGAMAEEFVCAAVDYPMDED